MAHFLYLVAIMDWNSDGYCRGSFRTPIFVLRRCRRRWKYDCPSIDQGSQFTSADWIDELKANNIKISMDGKGRWLDNVFVERLWRSLKYECVYLNAFDNMKRRRNLISGSIYNHEHSI